MTFHWPHAFWLLLLPLALLVRDLRRSRSASDAHPKITKAEANHSSLVIGPSSLRRGGAPRIRILFYLALAAATVALARPQWGRIEEPVFEQAREIIIALDLSRSMLAEDVKPTRLERARLLITSLLERLKGERVGLIVFSGTAFLQSPLSADYEILREFLPVLDPGYLPEGGTNYDALLDTTLSAFGASGAADRFLIVLSDGEALSDTWRKHLDELKSKGIRVLGLGIGTDAGAMIPDGSGAFMKDERGAVVMSKLNSVTLRELADKTDGLYADASAWVDLAQLIQNTVEQGQRGEFTETSRVRLAERFQWPLAAALACFLLSFWREFPVRPKPRPIQLAGSSVKTAAFLVLSITALRFPSSVHAAEGDTALSNPVTQIVGRLATREQATAAEYAELARATVTYGERARTSQDAVPEGVVRDALSAVDTGESLDPKAADWSGLREHLKALLPKENPPQQKQDPSKSEDKKPEQNKKEQSENKDQSDEPGEKGEQDSKSDEQKNKDEGSKPDASKSDENQQAGGGDKPSDKKPEGSSSQKKSDANGQSAFGDMKDQPPPASSQGDEKRPQPAPEQPAQDPSEMQQVGGASTEPSTDPARLDPALSVPLQKLDQVKQGDSPAQLFRLLQGPPSEPAPKGKDW
jgi:Ca-activated chloride channel family protein